LAAYGLYAWLAAPIVVIPVLILVAFAPGLLLRRRIAHWGARALFWLLGSPVRVDGARIDPSASCVVVANHASYLDGAILTAALPTHFTFLIKEEMKRFPAVGFLLRRLGSQFVNRENASQRHRIGRRLMEAAHRGDALAVFPEGTFDAEPGLRKFRAGAFRAARSAGIELFPVVILGARDKFPANSAWLRPGPLQVHICEALHAAGYASPQELVRATRAAMLEKLGEPDLDAAQGRHATSPHSSGHRPLLEAANECSEQGP
jgi:1-acyl-sn-glycerol-3-phosphate acyltransferase